MDLENWPLTIKENTMSEPTNITEANDEIYGIIAPLLFTEGATFILNEHGQKRVAKAREAIQRLIVEARADERDKATRFAVDQLKLHESHAGSYVDKALVIHTNILDDILRAMKIENSLFNKKYSHFQASLNNKQELK